MVTKPLIVSHLPPEEKVYKIGDFATTPNVPGVVYKVVSIKSNERFPLLNDYTLCPVFGAFGADEGRGYRFERSNNMPPVDIIRAGIEHMKMQNFIRELTTWRP